MSKLGQHANPSIKKVSISRVRQDFAKSEFVFQVEDDSLAVEEPLEIRLVYGPIEARRQQSISITMRTPGEDHALAAGFLFTEGIVSSRKQISSITHCGLDKRKGKQAPPNQSTQATHTVANIATNTVPNITSNIVKVELRPDVRLDLKKLERHFYTTSSCGVCGKSSLEALKVELPFVISPDSNRVKIPAEVIHRLPEALRATQSVFALTGGLHASALFSLNGQLQGQLQCQSQGQPQLQLQLQLQILCEDVGRHNALDKVIGTRFLNDTLPITESILLVSGRASFELVQKAAMAGIRILAAIGAPSSLAVELARETNMTLLGFVRDNRFNIYCGKERIALDNEFKTEPILKMESEK